MSRVVNSVRQIIDECNSMIAKANESEYFDVKSLASLLQEKCNELANFFNENPANEREIASLKYAAENIALRLEFYMDVRMGLYTDRRKLRKFSDKLYNDLRDICNRFASSSTECKKEDCMKWCLYTKWAIELYARSQHIIFELDEEDNKMVETIVNDIKLLEENES